ncbi:hypothetical protein A9Q84_01110 [Halobacteriovorax marinus]|uniref:Type II/III secretion system secretin-like domain-containing protein n=1 Tax=Halobacteriovorax marinus TaxID=97084 RepID=A0A1Y5FBT6_9BACT|nr:hypothetical protein A9Q84_01110 [Halobacteriovorax marinus]
MKSLIHIILLMTLISCSTVNVKKNSLKSSNLLDSEIKSCGEYIEKEKSNKFNEENLGIKNYLDKEKYTFEFLDLDVREALLELSTISNIPIVFGESVTGLITVNINEKSFLESLQMITSAGPFDYKFENDFYYVGVVMNKAPSWWRLAYNHNYYTKNLTPEEIINQINPLYREYLVGDNSRNVLTITAPRRILIDIMNQLAFADRARRQVKLNISISEVSNHGNKILSGLMGSPYRNGQLGQLVSLTREGLSSFVKNMRALQETGDVLVKANPTIITQDGLSALFASSVSDMNQTIRKKGHIIPLKAGINLKITPSITEKDNINLKIEHLEMGEIEGRKVTSHSLSTTIRVRKNESLLIGGMITSKDKTQVTKIPIISEIPLLGWFFKHEEKYKETSEVIFLIKPEILCD